MHKAPEPRNSRGAWPLGAVGGGGGASWSREVGVVPVGSWWGASL